MNKWKDTARTSKEIVKQHARGEKVVLSENTLVVIEKKFSEDSYLVMDTNPRRYNINCVNGHNMKGYIMAIDEKGLGKLLSSLDFKNLTPKL